MKYQRSLLLFGFVCNTLFQAFGQDHWTFISPNVNTFRCFAEDDQYLYAGTDFSYGSVLRSADHGDTWEDIRNGISPNSYVNRLLHAESTLYAGLFHEDGIFYRHIDSLTWLAATLPYPTKIHAIMKAGNPWNVFFAGVQGGAMISLDGIHWNDLSNGLNGNPVLDIIMVDSVLYAAAYYGVYTLQPGESIWQSFDEGLPGSEFVISIAAKGNKLYAGTYYHGIYVSTDHGAWTSMNNGINIENRHFNSFVFHQSSVLVGTSGGDYKGVFISNDEGGHWTELLDSFPPLTQVLALHISEPYIFAATSVGIYRRFLSSLTGQNEIHQSENEILVCPNPTTGHFHLSNLPVASDHHAIECTNQNGQVVYSDQRIDKNAENSIELDLSDLPVGLYFVRVIDRKKSWINKIIIAR